LRHDDSGRVAGALHTLLRASVQRLRQRGHRADGCGQAVQILVRIQHVFEVQAQRPVGVKAICGIGEEAQGLGQLLNARELRGGFRVKARQRPIAPELRIAVRLAVCVYVLIQQSLHIYGNRCCDAKNDHPHHAALAVRLFLKIYPFWCSKSIVIGSAMHTRDMMKIVLVLIYLRSYAK